MAWVKSSLNGSFVSDCTVGHNLSSRRDVRNVTLRNLRTFPMTATELKHLTAPATIGLNNLPKNGYSKPAITATSRIGVNDQPTFDQEAGLGSRAILPLKQAAKKLLTGISFEASF
jgi:hypothetical protein